MHQVDDTIAAIASAPGGGLRGIVRVSGPDSVAMIARQFRSNCGVELQQLAFAERCEGVLSVGGALGELPCAAYTWPSARSYTRQPTVELHTIGAPPVLEAILRSLCERGVRLAQPGEFTMRAFLAGRLDLTQAEAVLGVIDATGQRDLDVALAQLAGGLATPLHQLRERLLNMLAHLEAGLDFVEEDIEFIKRDELIQGLDSAIEIVGAVQQQMRSRSDADDSPRVVLVGSPNVGKSSLLNAMVGDDASIVSDVSGTTRDYVTRRFKLANRAITMIDTAGIEPETRLGGIASEAQTATRSKEHDAALVLYCVDATRPLNVWERREYSRTAHLPRLLVVTKVDVGAWEHFEGEAIRTSSVTGLGLLELREAIYARVSGDNCDAVMSTALRCHDSLRRARSSLEQARIVAYESQGEELVAGELRVGLEELGTVVGAIYTDDILDRIFSRFCIGK
ncbi:MAG: tRNA modification GTPase [Planctomycetaceae bacterium]|nr:tRNA modification GTPase [Planctomycetales bacterium]MCB9923852.1 tRNA modification GTPase [Planctomycetaceae bacterium]